MKRCLSEDLNVNPRDLVPYSIFIPEGSRQGQKPEGTGFGPQILQFYCGNNFGHFVCMLDFENWGTESCPRFSYYILDKFVKDELRGDGAEYRLVRVSSKFDWRKVDDGE